MRVCDNGGKVAEGDLAPYLFTAFLPLLHRRTDWIPFLRWERLEGKGTKWELNREKMGYIVTL